MTDQNVNQRVSLWNEHKQIAMLMLGDILKSFDDYESLKLPIIIITDNEDEFSNDFYEFLNKSYELNDETTIIKIDNNQSIMLMPVETVKLVTREYHEPFSLALMDSPPDDKIWVAVMAHGGLTLMHVPFEPLIPIGQA
jgi:hypothetical protein